MGRRLGIGANSYLLDLPEGRVVLDAGLHPKLEGMEATPDFQLLGDGGPPPAAAIVTHAHQDHVGSLPIFTRLFPQTPVFMSTETARIADVMLHNSVNVMNRQQEERGIPDAALFTHRSVELSRRMWRGLACKTVYDWSGERVSPSMQKNCKQDAGFSFHHAGHILGSTGVLIRSEAGTIFYTGDVQFDAQTLMRPADFPTEGVDTLIMETTRGDSPTPPGFTRNGEKLRLAEILNSAFADQSAVTIPVFALGKTQEILGMIWELKLDGLIPNVPVYIGGLSTKITEIYDAFCAVDSRMHPELHLLHEVAPYVVSGRDIDNLRPRKRCIYALSSGMLTENTLSNIFLRRVIEDPGQHVVFVGYSDPDSPAGKLRSTAQGDSVSLHQKLPPQKKLCKVHELNFSAHANRESLLAYAVSLRPRNILLVHGDPAAMEWFKAQLASMLPDTRVMLPQPGVRAEFG